VSKRSPFEREMDRKRIVNESKTVPGVVKNILKQVVVTDEKEPIYFVIKVSGPDCERTVSIYDNLALRLTDEGLNYEENLFLGEVPLDILFTMFNEGKCEFIGLVSDPSDGELVSVVIAPTYLDSEKNGNFKWVRLAIHSKGQALVHFNHEDVMDALQDATGCIEPKELLDTDTYKNYVAVIKVGEDECAMVKMDSQFNEIYPKLHNRDSELLGFWEMVV
jgi:hypothetical protein